MKFLPWIFLSACAQASTVSAPVIDIPYQAKASQPEVVILPPEEKQIHFNVDIISGSFEWQFTDPKPSFPMIKPLNNPPIIHLDTPIQFGKEGTIFNCYAIYSTDLLAMSIGCEDPSEEVYPTRYVACDGFNRDNTEIIYNDIKLKIRAECWSN